MKPTPAEQSQTPSTVRDPWKYLLATARAGSNAPRENESATDGFAVRVVAAWLRPEAASPRMLPVGDHLWEALGWRGALLACAAVLVGLCFNVSLLREDLNLDAWSLDPAVGVFGFTLENL